MNYLLQSIPFLLMSLVVPLAIAFLVVRGDWRLILIAGLIWYGGLLVVFGAWALVFAMFYSVVGLPVIALLLKFGKWLRARARHHTGSDGGFR